MKKKQIWVSEDFAKSLKKSAADNDMKILEYTKQLSEDIEHIKLKKKDEKFKLFK